jgi:hypothetical protein
MFYTFKSVRTLRLASRSSLEEADRGGAEVFRVFKFFEIQYLCPLKNKKAYVKSLDLSTGPSLM